MNLRDTYILNINNADYCCIISGIRKSKTIKVFQNIVLIEKKWNFIKNLLEILD